VVGEALSESSCRELVLARSEGRQAWIASEGMVRPLLTVAGETRRCSLEPGTSDRRACLAAKARRDAVSLAVSSSDEVICLGAHVRETGGGMRFRKGIV
jgi:hypothetical protein